MIERRNIQVDDIGITSFVFGVAAGATILFRILLETVKPGACFDIRCDVLMTIEAKSPLFFTGKRYVAIFARTFQICVTLDHRSRHNQGFNLAV